VRRFFCADIWCGMRTFAEQVAGLTRRRARRSKPLRAMLISGWRRAAEPGPI
jgi:hypothetical protein